MSAKISPIICELKRPNENRADFLSVYLIDYLSNYLSENRSHVTGLLEHQPTISTNRCSLRKRS